MEPVRWYRWRHLAPADQTQGLSFQLLVDDVASGLGQDGIGVEEQHTDRVVAAQVPSLLFGDRSKSCRVFAATGRSRRSVLPSAEIPPRCCMRAKADIARRTSLWLASPSMWANRPKPQLSLSSFGSYSDIAFLPCSAFHRTVINRLHKLRLALVVPSAWVANLQTNGIFGQGQLDIPLVCNVTSP